MTETETQTPALAAGTRVRVRYALHCSTNNAVVRKLIAGDLLTVYGHRPGEPLVWCLTDGPTRLKMRVPLAALREVKG